MTGLHVDPLTVTEKNIVDATGHDTEVLSVIARKADIMLYTETGKILGERSIRVAELILDGK
jgi:thiamine thiazole synthase